MKAEKMNVQRWAFLPSPLISFSPMDNPQPRRSILLSIHSLSWRFLEGLHGVARGLWSGLWLGLLSREHLHRIDQLSYGSSKSYTGADHNLSGLFGWETEAIDHYFQGLRRLLLLGAGAGREVTPLLDRGFDIDAFECHEGLRQAGNDLLARQGPRCSIQTMERDRCPKLEDRYDGVIIGWGMLTLVQGRQTRSQMLRDLRSAVPAGAPMLMSFYVLGGPHRRYRMAGRYEAASRSILGRDRLEFGDDLSPGFAHFFTRETIEEELREAGWRLELFDCRTYPHAVALADEDSVTLGN